MTLTEAKRIKTGSIVRMNHVDGTCREECGVITVQWDNGYYSEFSLSMIADPGIDLIEE